MGEDGGKWCPAQLKPSNHSGQSGHERQQKRAEPAHRHSQGTGEGQTTGGPKRWPKSGVDASTTAKRVDHRLQLADADSGGLLRPRPSSSAASAGARPMRPEESPRRSDVAVATRRGTNHGINRLRQTSAFHLRTVLRPPAACSARTLLYCLYWDAGHGCLPYSAVFAGRTIQGVRPACTVFVPRGDPVPPDGFWGGLRARPYTRSQPAVVSAQVGSGGPPGT
jgi:hypothetical protein